MIKRIKIPLDKIGIVPISGVHMSFLYFKSHHGKEITWNTLADLKPYRIGHLRGTPLGKRLADAGLILDASNSNESLAKKMHRKRIDIWQTNILSGHYMIKKFFPELYPDVRKTSKDLYVDILGLIYWKSDPEAHAIAMKFKESYSKILADGTFTKIQKSYWGDIVPRTQRIPYIRGIIKKAESQFK